MFGPVKGPVGSADQFVGALGIVPGNDAGRKGASRRSSVMKSLQNLVAGLLIRARHHHHELLAAVASQEVDLADVGGPGGGRFLEHAVTALVAVGVVVLLEVVEVEDGG